MKHEKEVNAIADVKAKIRRLEAGLFAQAAERGAGCKAR